MMKYANANIKNIKRAKKIIVSILVHEYVKIISI